MELHLGASSGMGTDLLILGLTDVINVTQMSIFYEERGETFMLYIMYTLAEWSGDSPEM